MQRFNDVNVFISARNTLSTVPYFLNLEAVMVYCTDLFYLQTSSPYMWSWTKKTVLWTRCTDGVNDVVLIFISRNLVKVVQKTYNTNLTWHSHAETNELLQCNCKGSFNSIELMDGLEPPKALRLDARDLKESWETGI